MPSAISRRVDGESIDRSKALRDGGGFGSDGQRAAADRSSEDPAPPKTHFCPISAVPTPPSIKRVAFTRAPPSRRPTPHH